MYHLHAEQQHLVPFQDCIKLLNWEKLFSVLKWSGRLFHNVAAANLNELQATSNIPYALFIYIKSNHQLMFSRHQIKMIVVKRLTIFFTNANIKLVNVSRIYLPLVTLDFIVYLNKSLFRVLELCLFK